MMGPAELMYSNGTMIKRRIDAFNSGMEDVMGTLTDLTVKRTVKPAVWSFLLYSDFYKFLIILTAVTLTLFLSFYMK